MPADGSFSWRLIERRRRRVRFKSRAKFSRIHAAEKQRPIPDNVTNRSMTVVWYQACIVSAVFDRHVLALDIARVLQALAEIHAERRGTLPAIGCEGHRRPASPPPARTRDKRPGSRCSSNSCNEIASSHCFPNAEPRQHEVVMLSTQSGPAAPHVLTLAPRPSLNEHPHWTTPSGQAAVFKAQRTRALDLAAVGG